MSNNKQSSVEWLIDQLEKWELYSKISFQCLKEIEQAKAMHKEEVLGFKDLVDNHQIDALENNTIYLTDEELYNEIFGGNK